VASGTYRRILLETELLFKLVTGTLKYETLCSQIQADNPNGTAWQRVSPLYLVEPILAGMLCELANMGEAQTRWEIMQLADKLIRTTIHADVYKEFCDKERWENNGRMEFLRRYSHKL
jgi:hypothetical protein